ncbi:Putative ribonuclease H protein At1g65750, partial [Linum grandiflorum]
DKDKIHWVAWDLVKTPRRVGGLGVQDLKILNTSLLSKWIGRFAIERNAWWRGLKISKCGVGLSEWLPCWNFGSAGCSMGKCVIRTSSLFWAYGYLDPGGGSSCSFWWDYWIREVRLGEVYPRIAAASQSLDSKISDLCFLDDRIQWVIPLSTSLRGGALVEWEHLLSRLAALPDDLITEGPACVIWPLEHSQRFSVRSLRIKCASNKFPGVPGFPHSSIWMPIVPSKVQCFCWMTFHKKIGTVDNLQRRGLQMVNRCALCLCDNESVDHLCLHCKFSSSVWAKVSSRLSIYGPISSDCPGFIAAWKWITCRSRFAACMKVILHSFLWSIWRERNNRIFREESKSSSQVFYKMMFSSGNWLAAADLFFVSQLQEWGAFAIDPG